MAESDVPRTLPRGPHRLAREVVLASQRGRLIDAIAAVVAGKGYGATTVADVIERAGVSRKTFYEHFRDKEACFLAAYETGVNVLLAEMEGADAAERLRAFLVTLATEPAFAQTFLIEIGAAGPRALERRRAVHDRFAAALHPEADAVRRLAAVGAINEVVTSLVSAGRTAQLPELEDDLSGVLAALLG